MTTAYEDNMSPDTSPSRISSGVRRVNNIPIYLIGAAVFVFLIVMMLVAADRANQQNRPEDSEKANAGNTNKFADKIAGNQHGGLIPASEPTKPLTVPELATQPTVTIARADNLNAPPLPPGGINQPHNPAADEALRIRQMKLQQLQEAIKAHTSVQIQAPRSAASAPGGVIAKGDTGLAPTVRQVAADVDPTEIYKAKLAKLQQSGLIPGTDGQSSNNDNSSAPQLVKTGAAENNTIDQFGNNGQRDRWQLNSQPEAPRSPFELRAGFVVPGTLISGINSELPGQIMAQVSQNVYDTPTGKYLLIPQGSRLVGAYSSQVAYGQARVLVAWQRIVFPDGKALDIGAMPGADSAGYAGFHDLVDNHYARIFGSALIMSAITAGIMYSQQSNQSSLTGNGAYSPNASSIMSQALGQQLGHVTAQMIQKNMNIAPTLEIRPGYRFNIIVTKDLTLTKPYQAFDY